VTWSPLLLHGSSSRLEASAAAVLAPHAWLGPTATGDEAEKCLRGSALMHVARLLRAGSREIIPYLGVPSNTAMAAEPGTSLESALAAQTMQISVPAWAVGSSSGVHAVAYTARR
jgi:hypothetical protein